MRVCGIIAEYNPFHNGHAYQLARARELSRADYVIVAMSGQLMQRGELALLDKWSRARAAVLAGADIVFELPTLFAVREAQGFARGGVGVLAGTGVLDCLCFGCETDDTELLSRAADVLRTEPPRFHELFDAALASGISHPAARARALSGHLGLSPDEDSALASPNAALALEYVQAIASIDDRITPIAVRRTGEYHSLELDKVCSASAIRANIRDDAVYDAVPDVARFQIDLARETGASSDFLERLALHTMRALSPEQLRAYPGVSEGLEYKLVKCARAASDFSELINMVKSKRYTRARLSRLGTLLALGVTRQTQLATPMPTYLRVLACASRARPLLAEIKRAAALPLVTSPARLPPDDPLMSLEAHATDLWGECTAHHSTRVAGMDFTHKFSLL